MRYTTGKFDLWEGRTHLAKLNEDTDRTKAIVIKNFSHRWLRWLDEFIGSKQAENGGYFDLHTMWRGEDRPVLTRETTEYKPQKLHD